MHAEHADNSEMNDMSARNKAPKRATQTSWFGGYFVDPIRLLQAAPEDQTRGPWSMNRTASSACLAPAPAKAGVHRLPASALRFFLGLPRHKAIVASKGTISQAQHPLRRTGYSLTAPVIDET
jgi:hypothetical protein